MISLKRSHVLELRSKIHLLEKQIQGASQIAENQRDLCAVACVALWDVDVRRLMSALRRLISFNKEWVNVFSYAQRIINFA